MTVDGPAFRLADPEAVYRVPVVVPVPGQDGPVEQEFAVLFRLLTPDEADRHVDDAGFLGAVVGGWEGVHGHGGEEIAFSPEALARLAAIPYVARALGAAYRRFELGLPGKTLSPSPDGSGAGTGGGAFGSRPSGGASR